MVEKLTFANDPDAIRAIFDEIRREAEAPYRHITIAEYQKMSSEEKSVIRNDIYVRGERLIRESPYRDEFEAMHDADHEAHLKAHMKLLADYQKRHPGFQQSDC